MDKEKNKDNLESFFRGELEHYQEDPGSEMWEKIATAIPPKPGLTAAAILSKAKVWLLLGGLIACLLFALWQYQRAAQLDKTHQVQELKMAALAQKLTELERQIANISRQQLETEVVNAALLQENPADKSVTPIQSFRSPMQQLSQVEKKHFAEAESISSVPSTEVEPELLSTGPLEELAPDRHEQNLVVKAPENRTELKQDIEFLNRTLPVQYAANSPLLENPIVRKNNDYYPRFSVGAWKGNIVVQYYAVDRRISPATGASSSVFLSNTAGLSAGIHLDRHWSLHTGLGFRNNGFSLSDQVSLEYTEANTVINEAGNPVGVYTFPQEGVLTFRAQIENQLQSSEPDIMEGESFHVEFNSAYRLRYYSIPLWVKYQLGQERFHAYLKGGFIWNKLMRDWAYFPSISLSSGRLSATNPQLTVSAARDSYFEFGLAMGVGYNITPRIELALEPSYYQAITSMLNVKPQTYGISAQLNYLF